jgi:outer membrane lipoprotein
MGGWRNVSRALQVVWDWPGQAGELRPVWRWVAALSSLVVCVACAPVISSEVRSLVDPRLSYAEMAANPETHRGKVLLVAGTIIEAKNLSEGTRLEILQYPTGSRGRPQTDQPSGGRFLVLAPDYLETAVYRPGRVVTVAGEVVGQRELPLGETTYRYPALMPRELYLWQEGNGMPRLHIGLGFGFSKGF